MSRQLIKKFEQDSKYSEIVGLIQEGFYGDALYILDSGDNQLYSKYHNDLTYNTLMFISFVGEHGIDNEAVELLNTTKELHQGSLAQYLKGLGLNKETGKVQQTELYELLNIKNKQKIKKEPEQSSQNKIKKSKKDRKHKKSITIDDNSSTDSDIIDLNTELDFATALSTFDGNNRNPSEGFSKSHVRKFQRQNDRTTVKNKLDLLEKFNDSSKEILSFKDNELFSKNKQDFAFFKSVESKTYVYHLITDPTILNSRDKTSKSISSTSTERLLKQSQEKSLIKVPLKVRKAGF